MNARKPHPCLFLRRQHRPLLCADPLPEPIFLTPYGRRALLCQRAGPPEVPAFAAVPILIPAYRKLRSREPPAVSRMAQPNLTIFAEDHLLLVQLPIFPAVEPLTFRRSLHARGWHPAGGNEREQFFLGDAPESRSRESIAFDHTGIEELGDGAVADATDLSRLAGGVISLRGRGGWLF